MLIGLKAFSEKNGTKCDTFYRVAFFTTFFFLASHGSSSTSPALPCGSIIFFSFILEGPKRLQIKCLE